MIRSYYGLEYNPFSREVASKYVHNTCDFKGATSRLEYCVSSKGIGLFTGGVGAGKTYCVREFSQNLNPNLHKIIYINSSSLTVLDFYRAICFSLGIEPPHRKIDMIKAIKEVIIDLYKTKKTPLVLIVDEAQYLKAPMFTDFPLLLNFEYDSKNYASLILIGLPHLHSILMRNNHEPLRQRIIIAYSFEGITKEEAASYIDGALQKAGCNVPIFSKASVEAIYSYSNGSFRRLNSLLNKCLIVGLTLDKKTIDTDTVLISQNEMGGMG